MKRNVLFFAMLFFSVALFAQVPTIWTNATGSGLWSDADNWSDGLPNEDSRVELHMEGVGACTLDTEATIMFFALGGMQAGGGDDELIIAEGGHLITGSHWSGIGWNSDARLVVEKGGMITFGEHMWCGWNGDSEVEIRGTVNVTAMYGTAFGGQPGSTYTAVMDGGRLNLAQLHPENSIPEGSILDVSGTGVIYIHGDRFDMVMNYVELGRISANDGADDPIVELIEIEEEVFRTIITVTGWQGEPDPEPDPEPAPDATIWTNATGSGLWSDAGNWSEGLPGDITRVEFHMEGVGACTLDIETTIMFFVLGGMEPGGGDDELIIADGGHLITGSHWSGVAWHSDARLVVERGGMITYGEHMWVGWNGDSEVEIYGTVNVTAMYGTAFGGQPGSTYTAVMDGGVLNLSQLHAENSIPEGSVLDVSGTGVVYLRGDLVERVMNYVELGRITANDGTVDPVVELIGSEEEENLRTVISVTGAVSAPDLPTVNTINIYPNPATDMVYISNVTAADIQVFSITGQKVLSQSNTTHIDVKDLRTGMYIVRVSADGHVHTMRLMKR